MDTHEIVSRFNLIPHPEGGYYSETYRSSCMIETVQGPRNACTAIFFLLEGNDKSLFHRIKSDELWFFHQGNALEILVLDESGLKTILLGNDVTNGESPQAVVPANKWFASQIKNQTGFALVSCTVSPGFSFEDFEMGNRKELLNEYPGHDKMITNFSKE